MVENMFKHESPKMASRDPPQACPTWDQETELVRCRGLT